MSPVVWTMECVETGCLFLLYVSIHPSQDSFHLKRARRFAECGASWIRLGISRGSIDDMSIDCREFEYHWNKETCL